MTRQEHGRDEQASLEPLPAGMTPLLFETSLQAQILVPLATSVVFGLLASTLLVLLIVPATWTIVSDLRGVLRRP